MNIKISVIIPVYNCQSVLNYCIESVQKQTLKDIEIICINDGSTDETAKVLKNIQKREARLIVFEQSNSGAGVARNLGLRNATGEYIAFLDADDVFFDSDALEKMYNCCKNFSVMACGSNGKALKNGEIYDINFFDNEIPRVEVVSNYRDYQIDFGYCFWIFNREFLISNTLFFPNYRRYQDPPFFVRVMDRAEKFTMVNSSLYCINVTETSKRYDAEKVIDLLRGFIDVMEFAFAKDYELLFRRTLHRTEWEYSDIIVKNLIERNEQNNRKILTLLLKIENMVKEFFCDESYNLRVIDSILNKAAIESSNYEVLLEKKVWNYLDIAIYGDGQYAKNLYNFFIRKKLDSKVSCFIVTDITGKTFFCGKPVVNCSGYIKDKNQGDFLICVATAKSSQDQVEKLLLDNYVTDYILIDNALMES